MSEEPRRVSEAEHRLWQLSDGSRTLEEIAQILMSRNEETDPLVTLREIVGSVESLYDSFLIWFDDRY